MRRQLMAVVAMGVAGIVTGSVDAANLAVSIGVRETGTAAAIGADGGTTNGIEFINLDGLTLPIDGAWHTFTFNFGTDAATAFAGATANSVLDGTRGTLEMLRLRNVDGVTAPLMVWIDDITNTLATGASTVVNGFETEALGTEVIFQEPGFSGSTSSMVMPGSTSSVVNDFANTGTQSYRFDYQWVDATPTNWVRITTFGTPIQPNPTIDFGPGSQLSFSLRAVVVPEPAAAALGAITALGLFSRRRRA